MTVNSELRLSNEVTVTPAKQRHPSEVTSSQRMLGPLYRSLDTGIRQYDERNHRHADRAPQFVILSEAEGSHTTHPKKPLKTHHQ